MARGGSRPLERERDNYTLFPDCPGGTPRRYGCCRDFVHIKGGRTRKLIRENLFAGSAAALLPVIMVLAGIIGEDAFAAVINVLLFACIIAVVVIGYSNREPVLINVGIVFFVLDVIARYFDFFWDMMPNSLFFMAGGVLLFVGGTLLERNRRKVIRGMKVNSYEV